MHLTIDKQAGYQTPEIIIRCNEIDRRLREIILYIESTAQYMVGEANGENVFIPLHDIYYFESVDKTVYIYTAREVYQSKEKLYHIEDQLADTFFARVSKTAILNLKKLCSVRTIRNSKLEGTLLNGEKIMISRQYMPEVKNRLGV